MQNELETTGMVISSMPVGEADRRILLLTREMGRISCFVRGARKPTSPFIGCTRTFAFGKFRLHPGRSAYSLQKAEISEYFEEVTRDVEKTAYGCYFLELASVFIHENTDGTEMLLLLWYALKGLVNRKLPNALVRCIFELKTLKLNGLLPDFRTCGSCRKPAEAGRFLPERMQLLCEDCAPEGRGLPLSPAAVYMLRFVAETETGKLFTFVVTPEVLREAEAVTALLRERVLDRPLKALEMLEILRED